jgi:hypothetical protein
MPKGWALSMAQAAGIPGGSLKCAVERSKTRVVYPCNHPEFGIHPNETCGHAVITALMRATPKLMAIYAIVYSIKVLMGKERWNGGQLLINYFRSVAMMAAQVHFGRLAFCVQSCYFPDSYQWWLGPVFGFVAATGLVLERKSARRDLVLMNAANAINCSIQYYHLQHQQHRHHARFVSGLLFATGMAIDNSGKNKFFDYLKTKKSL